MPRPNELLRDVLDLPAKQQAQIARRLLASLDETAVQDARGLWKEEVAARARDAAAGRNMTSWQAARQRLKARFSTR